jgi:ATP-dependent DNA ligase
MGRHLSRPQQGLRSDLCRLGRPWLRQEIIYRAAQAPDTADETQPYSRIAHQGIWVEPELLAEIEYWAKSAEGKVRHPFYKGLREDL